MGTKPGWGFPNKSSPVLIGSPIFDIPRLAFPGPVTAGPRAPRRRRRRRRRPFAGARGGSPWLDGSILVKLFVMKQIVMGSPYF